MVKVSQSDMRAFQQLYEHYSSSVKNQMFLFTQSRQDVDELAQDVFLNMWKHRQKLAGMTSFKGYLYTAARNAVIGRLQRTSKKTQRQFISGNSEEAYLKTAIDNADDRLITSENLAIAREVIEQLPARKKEIFKLVIEDCLSYDEIAARLSLTRGAVKNHYYDAARLIKENLALRGLIHITTILFSSSFIQ